MAQAALQITHQAQATVERELQQCKATASTHSTNAAQAAAATQAELELLRQQLSACQQETQAVRGREEEARNQVKQLATALTAAQTDYQVVTLVLLCSSFVQHGHLASETSKRKQQVMHCLALHM